MAELPESFSAPWTLWNGVNGLAYAYMLQLKHSLHREFGIVVGTNSAGTDETGTER